MLILCRICNYGIPVDDKFCYYFNMTKPRNCIRSLIMKNQTINILTFLRTCRNRTPAANAFALNVTNSHAHSQFIVCCNITFIELR